MFCCPKPLHRIHRFQSAGHFYVADIDARQCFQISELMDELLQRWQHLEQAQLIEELCYRYPYADVMESLDELSQITAQGFLCSDNIITNTELTVTPSHRMRILVPGGQSVLGDMEYVAGGATLASCQLLQALAKHVELLVPGSTERVIAPNIIETKRPLNTPASLGRYFLRECYDGIFLWNLSEFGTLRSVSQTPIVSRLFSPRGHNGRFVNLMLRSYAAMCDFDAFISPTQSVVDFYSRFVEETDCFHVVPNGVNTELFRPMDKGVARKEASQLVANPQIDSNETIIGFFSRFQPEKGAGVYLQLARLLPQFLFLVITPSLKSYSATELPDNVIYAGPQSRQDLPLFINCFDLHCFPSMVGEESFGNAVREAMACGVPPVVPDVDGLAENVGDGGIVVGCENYTDEIGSFAASVSPYRLSEAITEALSQPEQMQQLRARALAKARSWTWDDAAKRVVELFKELNIRRELQRWLKYPVRFVPHWDNSYRHIRPCAMLLNHDGHDQFPLMFHCYRQSMLDGIALKLLRKHTLHEVEAVLLELCDSRSQALEILQRVRGFRDATS